MITESNRFTQKWIISIKVKDLLQLCKENELLIDERSIRRTVYDSVIGDAWETVVTAPFVKNATDIQMNAVNDRLVKYLNNINLLTLDVYRSIDYRSKQNK